MRAVIPQTPRGVRPHRAWIVYGAMVVLTIVGFLPVRHQGESLVAPAPGRRRHGVGAGR